MSPRQIHTLMRRFFYGDIPMSDGYRSIERDGSLARDLVEILIADYIPGDEVLVYLASEKCGSCQKSGAFTYIEKIYSRGRLRLASVDFQGQILIEPIGVGVGSNNARQRTASPPAELYR